MSNVQFVTIVRPHLPHARLNNLKDQAMSLVENFCQRNAQKKSPDLAVRTQRAIDKILAEVRELKVSVLDRTDVQDFLNEVKKVIQHIERLKSRIVSIYAGI